MAEELYKIAPEWSICYKCKHNDSELCFGCTSFYGYNPVVICGISCMSSVPQYYHKNYERKET